jgi:hypothetical protein
VEAELARLEHIDRKGLVVTGEKILELAKQARFAYKT